MRTHLLLLLMFCLTIGMRAQVEKGSPCRHGDENKKVQLHIRLITPAGHPFHSPVQLVINNVLHTSGMDSLGIYKTNLDPGTYTLKFSAPFYEVVSDGVKIEAGESKSITVRFQHKAFILPETRQGLCQLSRCIPLS